MPNAAATATSDTLPASRRKADQAYRWPFATEVDFSLRLLEVQRSSLEMVQMMVELRDEFRDSFERQETTHGDALGAINSKFDAILKAVALSPKAGNSHG